MPRTARELPRVDLACGADPREVGAALAANGAFVADGHGIAAAEVAAATAASERAFRLPDAAKLRCRGPLDGTQRGYLPVRTHLPDGREALDRKEAWHARPAGHAAANLFPPEVPELGACLLRVIERLEALSLRILAGVGAHLGAPPHHFEERVRGGDSLFRVNFYPAEPDAPAERARFLPHRDFDLVTLLFGASGPGLEVQAGDGAWRAMDPADPGVVVLAGDVLAVESGGRIASAPHRVTASSRAEAGRISMVYFVSPRPEVVLANGLSAGDFVGARLREAGYG